MQCALSHCLNNWYDNRNFLLFEKKQGEKNGSLAQCMGESLMLAGNTWLPWGKAALAEFYKELFAGNPGLVAEELAALEKSLEKSAGTESEERGAGGV